MTPPAFIRAQKDSVLLSIRLQPRASRNEVGTVLGSELRVKVTAPPVDSAANEALLLLIAKTLDCAKSQVELAHGQTSRHKTVRIRGVSAERVLSRLAGGRE